MRVVGRSARGVARVTPRAAPAKPEPADGFATSTAPSESPAPRGRGAGAWLHAQGARGPARVPLRAGDRHEVVVEWGGRPHRFTVTVTPELAAWAKGRRARLDLERAQVAVPGEPPIELGVAARYAERAGHAGPAWVQYRESYDVFGPPAGECRLGLDEAGRPVADAGGELRVDFEVLVSRMKRSVPSPEARAPYDRPFHARPLEADVTVEAETPELLALAAELFRDHVGAEAAAWPARVAELDAEIASLKRRRARLDRAKDPGALVAEVRAELAPGDEAAWTVDDAKAAIKAKIAELKRIAKPVALVVVPAAKHWTAMPQVRHRWPEFAEAPKTSLAANAFTKTTRFVFLPEEDLRSHQGTSRHELDHLVFARLPAETKARIRAVYDRLLAAGGPFAREYGRQWKEFYTTYGEVFGGRYGPEVLRAMKERVPDLYAIFREVTGRDPA